MSLETNMDRVLARRQEIEGKLAESGALSADQLTQLSRELAEVRPVAEQVELVRQLAAGLQDARQMAEEETDSELVEMAQAETEELSQKLAEEEQALKLLLLPKDTDDARNAILEVRAGTGGEEAALFASDLFGMYQRFAAKYGWRFEVMEVSETGIGGYKEATANISGQDRVWCAPGPARPRNRDWRAYPYLGGNGCCSARSPGCRYQHQRKRSEGGCVSRVRSGRPVGQYH